MPKLAIAATLSVASLWLPCLANALGFLAQAYGRYSSWENLRTLDDVRYGMTLLMCYSICAGSGLIAGFAAARRRHPTFWIPILASIAVGIWMIQFHPKVRTNSLLSEELSPAPYAAMVVCGMSMLVALLAWDTTRRISIRGSASPN